ncbi:MAG: hypothetical protein H6502_01935 [Candidatus Woesearchaeota archaeon]|nr:MAG: hypothetical protein H6502_01935 [Candidatus Woesearchaeota archaeon]
MYTSYFDSQLNQFVLIQGMLLSPSVSLSPAFSDVEQRKQNESLFTRVTSSQSSASVPLSVFSDRRLTIFEALVYHLHHEKKLAYKDVAKLLCRDNRTIWTVFKRAEKKMQASFSKHI